MGVGLIRETTLPKKTRWRLLTKRCAHARRQALSLSRENLRSIGIASFTVKPLKT